MIKKLTEEINNLKQILSLRKKRGNFGDIENQFVKLKEENERLKQNTNGGNQDVEKLIYENKVLKLELQKMRSKSDFYEYSDILSRATIEKTPKNNKEDDNNTMHIRIKSIKDMNQYNEDITSNYNSKKNLIMEGINNFSKKNQQQNLDDEKFIDLKSPLSGNSNIDFLHNLNKQSDGNNLNDVIDNLILNTNNNNLSKSISNVFSNKSLNNDGDISLKKSSLNSSLFKAGESIVGSSSNFSSIINTESRELKKFNERLRYLEKLEKESSMNLNKQREKIKSKHLKKEEEMKKKIEDVIYLIILNIILLLFFSIFL